jgi:hypothetical protein
MNQKLALKGMQFDVCVHTHIFWIWELLQYILPFNETIYKIATLWLQKKYII